MSASDLQAYWLSKWTCAVHGHFSARTHHAVSQEKPVHCPECVASFGGAVRGFTKDKVPDVSKPRWPKSDGKSGFDRTYSKNAPIKKRGQSQERPAPVRFLPS